MRELTRTDRARYTHQLGDSAPAQRVEALVALAGDAVARADGQAALRWLGQALEAAACLDSAEITAPMHMLTGSIEMDAGHPEAAGMAFLDAASTYERAGLAQDACVARLQAAVACMNSGSIDAVFSHARRAFESVCFLPDESSMDLAVGIAETLSQFGAAACGLEVLDLVEDCAARSESTPWLWNARSTRVVLLNHSGRAPAAIALAQELLGDALDADSAIRATGVGVLLVDLQLRIGNRASALRIVSELHSRFVHRLPATARAVLLEAMEHASAAAA